MEKKDKKVLILINDSDPLLARVCKSKFQKEGGWNSEITTDFDEAIKKTLQIRPDLVITEIIINDPQNRTGFDLIKEIRNNADLKETNIVVFSELSQDSDKQKAIEIGANSYYIKSEVTIMDIIEEIKKMIK